MTISDNELADLADDLESDRVERKAMLTDKNRIGQAICAFANDLPDHGRPGVLLIGVRDDGSPAGLPITDELLMELADFRDQGQILPLPALSVARRSLDGVDVAVVSVTPENFGRPGITDYRNPAIAEAMRALGYVQRFGAGMAITNRALAENGNPPPEFDVTSSYVYVTVRRTS